MALGFGFNKAKVMAVADKFVQQGKLQNAINEYEKVIKADPNDLTVLNTTGDLWWRLGKVDQAIIYFKRVGDTYASQGFLVKAIAMYKKLAKLSPSSTENTIKLAELYAQQGLNNDARAQYMVVADGLLKARDNQGAAEIFKTMLKLDPTNVATQSKLADLYLKLGKRDEAKNIYFNAAQTLFERDFKEAATEALRKGLQIDPENPDGLILRGRIAADAGDPAGAIEFYQSIPGLDANAAALRALLSAKLQMQNWVEAEPVALTLLQAHNDSDGLTTLVDKMMAAGEADAALRVYDSYTAAFVGENPAGFRATLEAVIGKVKDSPRSLERLRSLFEKIGEHTQRNELTELLAHAYVEQGQLEVARDLYHDLAKIEPQNPLHYQNYKQVLSKLGQDTPEVTAEQGGEPLMAAQTQSAAASSPLHRTGDATDPLRAALTEAELFSSYNLPAKAIAALEAVLPSDPGNIHINTELSILYAKVGHFSAAAHCCGTLSYLYEQEGDAAKSKEFADAARKYESETDVETAETSSPSAPSSTASPADLDLFPVASASSPVPPTLEFDIGSEWETMVSQEVESPAPPPPPGLPPVVSEETSDAMAEARFYIAQSMWPQAMTAIDNLENLIPGSATVADLRARATEGVLAAAHGQAPPQVDAPSVPRIEPAAEPSLTEFGVEPVRLAPEPAGPPPAAEGFTPAPLPTSAAAHMAAPQPASVPPPAPSLPQVVTPQPGAAAGFDFGLDEALGDDFALAPAAGSPTAAPHGENVPPPLPVRAPSAPGAPIAPKEAGNALSDIFADFKEEMEGEEKQQEDPETHYSLGIAFKEMGLLDEAIGELQSVCRAIENGAAFSQPVPAYTWLAQCLIDKGAAQAAVPWYEKALQVPGIDQQSKLAISYDLACANQAAGDSQAALKTFMQVYGSNIDYRDVAQRIKALKP